jgi:hypothetical protein
MNLPAPAFRDRRLSHAVLGQLVAICLVVVGCKLWLIGSHGSPLPFLDQWKGEGAEVLRPWLKGVLGPADLVAPFNEHRIVPSRLLVLGLFELNARQWDSQVQMVAGAALHAACAFVLGAILVAGLGARHKGPIFAALLVLFCLPFDWQNTLWGFQSQFYFLILFTVIALWGLGWHAAGTARWWCGVGAGFLACFSMASGGFAGLALAGWLVVKFLLHPETRRDRGNWITFAAALAFGALGFALYTPPKIESLTALHVQSPGAFLHGFAIHLGWPNSSSPLFGLVAFAPFATLLGLRWARRRDPASISSATSVDDFLFPLGIWVALQAAALAWSRNHAMASVISRYMDLLALGALVNLGCLLRLATFTTGRWPRRALLVSGLAWTALAIAGLVPLLQRNFRLDLPTLNQIHRIQATAVRQFLITGRSADLGGKPVFGLPPADLDLLADLLRDPVIQNALPTGLGIRRVSVPPGPLTTASHLATDGWALLLGSGAMILLFTAAREWLARRRTTVPIPPITCQHSDVTGACEPRSSAANPV